MHTHVVSAEITGIGMGAPPYRLPTLSNHRYPRTDREPVCLGRLQLHREPVAPRPDLITQQTHRPVIIDDDNVDGAVIINVTECGSVANPRHLKRGAAKLRSLAEAL